VFLAAVSYTRFVVNHDYIVGYEGSCDPEIFKCFVGYEDGTSEKELYYSKIKKYAPDLYKQCGEDITGCESANRCFPEDRHCSIIYCDEKKDDDTCSQPFN